MRLLIIRHADPDYEQDSLTPKGWKEAGLLAERLEREAIDQIYVSPLGRAKATCSLTLQKKQMTAEERYFLREFDPRIHRPDVKDGKIIAWDWLPADWTAEDAFYDRRAWSKPQVMQEGQVQESYQEVTKGIDQILADHGYQREGGCYRAVRANRDTLAFFCHFGVECVILSHLLEISPMLLWHGTCAAPSSVTTLYTEERRPGIARFRMTSFGDLSHLYAGGEPPAFAARFCEVYEDRRGERVD